MSVDQLYCVGGSAGKSGLVTLLRLRKCYPNSQHLLFDLFCGRLSYRWDFPTLQSLIVSPTLYFKNYLSLNLTKEYTNCYPGHSGWTGNFLSCLLSSPCTQSVYVWRCTRVAHVWASMCSCQCLCAYVSVGIRAYVCTCVHVYVLCFCICVYMGMYLCMSISICAPVCFVCVCVSVGIMCASEHMWMCVYFGLSYSGVNY